MVVDQWYVDAATLKTLSRRLNRAKQFVPANWEKTYFDWMENISLGAFHASFGGDIKSRHGTGRMANICR